MRTAIVSCSFDRIFLLLKSLLFV